MNGALDVQARWWDDPVARGLLIGGVSAVWLTAAGVLIWGWRWLPLVAGVSVLFAGGLALLEHRSRAAWVRKAGLTVREAGVVDRLVRRGRVPDDAGIRTSMAALMAQHRSAARQNRRLMAVCAVLFFLNAVFQWPESHGPAVVSAATGVVQVLTVLGSLRTSRRFDRLEPRLAEQA